MKSKVVIFILVLAFQFTLPLRDDRFFKYENAYEHAIESSYLHKAWTDELIVDIDSNTRYTFAFSDPRNVGVYKFEKNLLGWRYDRGSIGSFDFDDASTGELKEIEVHRELVYGACIGQPPAHIWINDIEATILILENQDYYIWYVHEFIEGDLKIVIEM